MTDTSPRWLQMLLPDGAPAAGLGMMLLLLCVRQEVPLVPVGTV